MLNRALARLCLVVAFLTMSPLHAANARDEAKSHVMPHAAIAGKDLLNDEVLKRVPADSAFFRSFLGLTADDLSVSVILPPLKDINTTGYAQPLVQVVGTSETSVTNGQRTLVAVLHRWVTYPRRGEVEATANVEFVLTVSYDRADGAGAMILPCTAEVRVKNDREYSYRNATPDLRKITIVTRPK